MVSSTGEGNDLPMSGEMAGRVMAVSCGMLLILMGVQEGMGQPFRKEVYAPPISAAGAPIVHPFSGGYYNPAHQFVDIDADGDLDLFLYDFNDGSFEMYRNTGSRQLPQFQWERPAFVVPTLMGWFRFADINGNGTFDLLTGGDNNSIAVYMNIGTPSAAQFTLQTASLLDSAGSPVYSQIQCIPALADMDGDGDLDFLSLNPGIGTINYYQNIGSVANFQLAFRTDRYQNIQICPGCNGQESARHGQGTMYFADVDADRDFDMFYGDLFDEGIFFYQNIGTPSIAILDSVSGHFPSVNPVLTNGFNQPTLVDIDGDNDLDLFVSVLPPFQQMHGFWFYRNAGDSVNYNFSLITRDYLSTFDVGIQSVPAFADIDSDGDKDLFVGDLYGHVGFVKNEGNASAPLFSFVDSFFVSSANRYGYAPAFADIDADGNLDMFLGHFGGNIEFYRNVGAPGAPSFQRQLSAFDSLNVGNQSYASLAFFDIDNDGDLDLFVGKQDGRIAFFRNAGTPQLWRFALESSFFSNIALGFNARPVFADVDNDGDRDLVVGASDGGLYLFRNDGPVGNPVFSLVNNDFGSIDIALEAAPALADIDNDGDLDLVVGNLKGGLEFYRNDLLTSVGNGGDHALPDATELLQNYPNPFNPATTLGFRIAEPGFVSLSVFDVLGREIVTLIDEFRMPGIYTASWDGTNAAGARVSSGVYFYRMTAGAFAETKRFILLK